MWLPKSAKGIIWLNVQLLVAVLLTLSGIVLLFMGMLTDPAGEIHGSVLVAFGEMSTFAGALFGVDYSYKYKLRIKQESEER